MSGSARHHSTSDASALPSIDHAERVRTIVDRLPSGDGCDALLVLDLTDVRWLTGFTGSNGWAVVRRDGATLGTDGRYRDRAVAETAGSGVDVIAEETATALEQRLVETLRGAERVALDASTTPHSRWTRLAAQAPLEPTDSSVRLLRQVLDDAELARIERAARAADAALTEVEPLLLATGDEPMTEHDVRTELEYRMRLHGADDRSYSTIVATGPVHGARPHHDATRRTIVEGDTVIIDVGALVDGYHSDMTRSWVIGEATPEQVARYALVAAAQSAGIGALAEVGASGVAAVDIDAAARTVLDDAGYGDWYVHGTGHGVGLDIHELPMLVRTSRDHVRWGNVVTIEPGLYREGFGGFRIEDLVVVTEDGPRVLTQSPKRGVR